MPEGTVRSEVVTPQVLAEAALMEVLHWRTECAGSPLYSASNESVSCYECGVDVDDLELVIAELDATRAKLAEAQKELETLYHHRSDSAMRLADSMDNICLELDEDGTILDALMDAASARITETREALARETAEHAETEEECQSARAALTDAQATIAQLTGERDILLEVKRENGAKLYAAQATIKALMDTVSIVLDADAVSPNAAKALDGALQSASAALASRPSDASKEGGK